MRGIRKVKLSSEAMLDYITECARDLATEANNHKVVYYTSNVKRIIVNKDGSIDVCLDKCHSNGINSVEFGE